MDRLTWCLDLNPSGTVPAVLQWSPADRPLAAGQLSGFIGGTRLGQPEGTKSRSWFGRSADEAVVGGTPFRLGMPTLAPNLLAPRLELAPERPRQGGTT